MIQHESLHYKYSQGSKDNMYGESYRDRLRTKNMCLVHRKKGGCKHSIVNVIMLFIPKNKDLKTAIKDGTCNWGTSIKDLQIKQTRCPSNKFSVRD